MANFKSKLMELFNSTFRNFSISPRGVMVFWLMLCAVGSSGCGLVSRMNRTEQQVFEPRVVRVSAPVQIAEVHIPAPINTPPSVALPMVAPRQLPDPALGITPEVNAELVKFLTTDRGSIDRIIERKGEHDPMIQAVFEEEGVPADLANLAGIESHFNPVAKSPAGARGMWQFMASTAEIYGLRVNRHQDERVDPKRSTVAAARLLKDLYKVYRDWHLALAAYNAGTGTIAKAVSRAGSSNFWTLARAGMFARETERFVPRFIALSIIMREPERYGFSGTTMLG